MSWPRIGSTKRKTSDPTRQRPKLRSELAGLETLNTRTLQELRDAEQAVARLRTRKSELEAICRQQSEQIHDGEMCLDDFTQALTDLTLRFHETRPRPDNVLVDQGNVPAASKLHTIKPEHGEYEDSKLSSLEMYSPHPIPRSTDHTTPLAPRQPESRQRLLTDTALTPSSPPREYNPPEKHPQKRGLSSDAKNDGKRRKEDHAPPTQQLPQQKASDPRLQAGRRQRS